MCPSGLRVGGHRRKPGNVHRYRDFADTSYTDFIISAAAISPALEHAVQTGVGNAILDGIRATRAVVRSNTNLGIMLVLAPLAAAPRPISLMEGVGPLLDKLSVEDARYVYKAIRLAAPGGLGRVADQDVSQPPTQTLKGVMALAADRDLIARQYVNDFGDVFRDGVPALESGLDRFGFMEDAIINCHLILMSNHPDTLIRGSSADRLQKKRRSGRKMCSTAAGRKPLQAATKFAYSTIGCTTMATARIPARRRTS